MLNIINYLSSHIYFSYFSLQKQRSYTSVLVYMKTNWLQSNSKGFYEMLEQRIVFFFRTQQMIIAHPTYFSRVRSQRGKSSKGTASLWIPSSLERKKIVKKWNKRAKYTQFWDLLKLFSYLYSPRYIESTFFHQDTTCRQTQ